MLPFELVATATDSPRYSPAGSLRKSGTDVKGISGTLVIVAFCWADADAAMSSKAAAHAEARCRFMNALSRVCRIAVAAGPTRRGVSSAAYTRLLGGSIITGARQNGLFKDLHHVLLPFYHRHRSEAPF